jgi:hypothetical protein
MFSTVIWFWNVQRLQASRERATLAAGTACRDLLRALPRMEIALLVMFLVLASARTNAAS